MEKIEIKGFLKGVGTTLIIMSMIFYGLIVHLQTTQTKQTHTNEEIVEMARDLGMIYITEIKDVDLLTKDYIIKMAKSYGMEYKEAPSE
ncbi:hypothetical protein [Petrocella sp. FN5]|uniref:hypothetical protein n=1 Tax=Petrocella sp. FN5 TaxID=3032002 RepID=UPI0023DA4A2F|nr:hypothetical protein [Petrocella sp. FN5]MDF1616796.1 hypothetical protein [Petrocella sp. FN5]